MSTKVTITVKGLPDDETMLSDEIAEISDRISIDMGYDVEIGVPEEDND